MKITAEPRSDQWNADDFIGAGHRTFTISDVKVGAAEQKYDIELAEGDGRVWRPPLTVLRILLAAWGDESDDWVGRRVTLYRDPSIRFGADAVGGIRIAALSHIDKPMNIALTETRGRRKPHRIDPLPDEPPTKAKAPKTPTAASIIDAFKALDVTVEQLELRIGADHENWTPDDITTLAALGKSIKAGETTIYEEFEATSPQQGEPTEADQ